MTLSPHTKKIFLFLALFILHPTVTSAEQPAPITFTATPDNHVLLRDNNTLKRKYRERLKSPSDQGNLQSKANLYCILGDLENVTGDFRAAEIAYNEAESRYESENNFLGLGRVWYGRGEIERKRNQHDKAENSYEKAIHYYDCADSRQGRAAVQLALGHIKRTTIGPEEARKLYESAKDLYERGDSELGKANVLCALGGLECSLGNYAESVKAYDQAASIYNTRNNLLGLANVLIGRGNLARVQNDNDQALEFYKQAENYFKRIRDDLGQANVLTGIAHLERKFPAPYHWGKSSNYYGNALRVYTKFDNTSGMANVLVGQGDLEILRGNHKKSKNNKEEADRYYEAAEATYLNAKRSYEDIGDKLGQANVSLSLGRLEVIQGKPDLALTWYQQAENFYFQNSNLLGQANALTERGHLLSMLAKNEVDRILSLNIYDKAKKGYSNLGNRLGEAHVFCGIGWLERKFGRLEEAQTAFKEARCLYEQLEDYQGKDAADQFLEEIESKKKEQLAQKVPFGTPIITNPPSEGVQNHVSPLVEADKTHLIETFQKIWSEITESIKRMLTACKNIIHSICEYLLRNLDWLFSGGMISTLGALLIIRRKNNKPAKQNDNP